MIRSVNKLTYWSDGKAPPSSVTVKRATKNTVNTSLKETFAPKHVFKGNFCNVLFSPFRLVSHIAVKHTRHQEKKGPLLGVLSA